VLRAAFPFVTSVLLDDVIRRVGGVSYTFNTLTRASFYMPTYIGYINCTEGSKRRRPNGLSSGFRASIVSIIKRQKWQQKMSNGNYYWLRQADHRKARNTKGYGKCNDPTQDRAHKIKN
jgi:hypothetical protein